ncbi:hypothetical protein PI95_019995 [Hassallia byssoidea VB512170]|uniref:Uncharacterized protein n=1 Tax=Hassallia byssoidea VB512170 TaxID=1304833 RepID=A0A846HDL9_9CYAN|nr:hypothetical protein [Hassalia byssoidea]NEU74774.1 hypothetical protein [Hassalia byssoidea VB512170]
MGNGASGMGHRASVIILFLFPSPNAHCPMPSIITIGKTSHQVDEGKNHPTIY